jgi:hypothetical protein
LRESSKMQQLVEAIKQNNLDKVKELISTVNINETFKEWNESKKIEAERTPLQYAANAGHLEIVQLLLEFGADINKGRIDTGATPLYGASIRGHLEVVKLLIENGADINKSDNNGWTPLNSATSRECC